ncbi:MAG: ferrous iron transport protein A [Deltaproteobacteria bacterium]|jgi:ferrous iron transport protein A|nr:ferrous iron transport protein A [Deltaproteobacteria bacterium]
MMSLELLTPGERGEITEVRHCGGCGCHGHSHSHDHEQNHGHYKQKANATRAEEMGLRVGKMVKVLKNDGNLLLLLVDEARIAIDRRMARSINVKGVTA